MDEEKYRWKIREGNLKALNRALRTFLFTKSQEKKFKQNLLKAKKEIRKIRKEDPINPTVDDIVTFQDNEVITENAYTFEYCVYLEAIGKSLKGQDPKLKGVLSENQEKKLIKKLLKKNKK